MKAIVAVAASLLTAVYHMLRTDQDHQDLGTLPPRHQPPPRWRWYAGCRPRAMIRAISQRSL
jgi:hypothetical protein